MTRFTSLLTAASLAAGLFASPLAVVSAEAAGLTLTLCPAGTHAGYLGRHCWANHHRLCPPGHHIGYEGKYCWRNRH